MAARFLLMLMCTAQLPFLLMAGGHGGGGHKKVIIHVPYKVHHHHHKHTIVKHIHHKAHGGGGGDDHYEVLGYTYGQAKPAPHFGGGKGWHAADESDGGHNSPVSFEGDQGYGVHGASDYGLSSSDSGYGISGAGADYGGYSHSAIGGEDHGSY